MKTAPWRWLPLVFAAVALAFVSATAFTQSKTSAIDNAASEIATNASPSIQALASARGESRHLWVLLRERLLLRRIHDAEADTQIEQARKKLDTALAEYFGLPTFPDEDKLWGKMREGNGGLDAAIAHFEQLLADDDVGGARAFFNGPLTERFTRLSDGISEAIELNARHSGQLALLIRHERETSTRLAFGLDIGCVVLTLLAAIVLLYGMRSHARLLERSQAADRDRALELEQFAGRIAHDILSPIGTVALAIDMAGRAEEPAKRQRALDRGRSSIARVKRLVDGLLGFARAGARPEHGARALVSTVIADVVEDNRHAADEAGVDLRTESDLPEVEVACTDGVLTSLVANLVRNAIKYIGDMQRKEVVVRATTTDGGLVHVEVADTGPGLPSHVALHVFEPFFRGERHSPSSPPSLPSVPPSALSSGAASSSSPLGVPSDFSSSAVVSTEATAPLASLATSSGSVGTVDSMSPSSGSRAATGASIGLGLATVRKLAEAHGGSVGVYPTLGGGATFWFDIPLVQRSVVCSTDAVSRTATLDSRSAATKAAVARRL